MSKELVLFVPGFHATTRGVRLQKLVENVKSYCDHNAIAYEAMDVGLCEDGSKMQTLRLTQNERTIDFKEVYWVDLMPRLSDKTVWNKALDGLAMILFWFGSLSVWKVAGRNKYFFVNLLVTVALVLLWYLSTLGMAVELLSNEWKGWIPQKVTDYLLGVNSWFVLTAMTTVFPVNTILNITYATKHYLQNMNGLFHEVTGRVRQSFKFEKLFETYEHISIVAHSFGTIVTVEALALEQSNTAQPLRLITFGGSLRLLGANSPRLKKAARQLLNESKVGAWFDFYSDQDWLCSGASLSGPSPHYHPFRITSTVPLLSMIVGASHDLYFHDWDVMKTILSEPEADEGSSENSNSAVSK